MRHTFVFLEIFSQEGGIQSYVKDLLEAYLASDRQTQADIFLLRDNAGCPNPFAQEPRLRFHYASSSAHRSPAALGRFLLAVRLAAHLLGHRPTQVICGHIKLAPLVQRLCAPLALPYVVMTYGKEVWQVLAPHQRRALQSATAIWTISRYSRDRLCAANEIPVERVALVPCVVDGDRFTPGPAPERLRDRYGLTGSNVLMTVARLWSGDIYKGVDVTIRALPQILAVYPTLKYLVIGRGDDQPRLAQLAQTLGVAEQVVFAGFVPTEDLAAHYRLADGYVMPSQEGFGIVYLEAMACGIAVISGDADGSADPLQDGRVGWRVPHRDPQAVAAACLALLQGQDPRVQGDWLRQQTLAQFGKAALAQQLKPLLRPAASLSGLALAPVQE